MAQLRRLRAEDGDDVAALLRRNPHRRTDAEEVRSWLHAAIDPNDLHVLVETAGPWGTSNSSRERTCELRPRRARP